jgi:MFS family permease
MALVSTLTYYDRNLVYVLSESIKLDLSLSDAQVGMLTGLAFSAPYCMAALVGGRFSDRSARVAVLSASIVFWSLATSIAGVSRGLGGLALSRAVVGASEAVGVPASHAVAADAYSSRYRGRLFGFIALMGVVGELAALILGGVLNDRFGWRATFMLSGVPGIILALVCFFTIGRHSTLAPASNRSAPGYGVILRALGKRRAYSLLVVGFTLTFFGNYAFFSWMPALLMRNHHMTTSQIGTNVGWVIAVSVLIGTALGGVLADILSKYDVRFPYIGTAICIAGILPIRSFLCLYSTDSLIDPSLFMMYLLNGLWYGPLFASIQNLAGAQARATATSIALGSSTLIGAGLGPWITGALSDEFRAQGISNPLGLAITLASLTLIPAAACFILACRTLKTDLHDAEEAVGDHPSTFVAKSGAEPGI